MQLDPSTSHGVLAISTSQRRGGASHAPRQPSMLMQAYSMFPSSFLTHVRHLSWEPSAAAVQLDPSSTHDFPKPQAEPASSPLSHPDTHRGISQPPSGQMQFVKQEGILHPPLGQSQRSMQVERVHDASSSVHEHNVVFCGYVGSQIWTPEDEPTSHRKVKAVAKDCIVLFCSFFGKAG